MAKLMANVPQSRLQEAQHTVGDTFSGLLLRPTEVLTASASASGRRIITANSDDAIERSAP